VLDSTVNVLTSDVSLKGSADSRILNGQTNLPALLIGDGITALFRIKVADLVFAGKTGVTGVAGQVGMKVDKVRHSWFENLTSFAFDTALFDSFVFDDLSQSTLNGFQVQSSLGSGVEIINSVDLYVSNSRSDGNIGTAWEFKDSEGMYFNNVTAFQNNIAFNITTGTANDSKNMFFTNCIGDSSDSFNWLITNLSIGLFSNCWGTSQKSTSVNTFASGFHMDGADALTGVQNLQFVNCTAVANNAHGYTVTGGAGRVKFINCTGEANGQGGPGSGFNISTSTECIVSNSHARSNPDFGIDINVAAANLIVTENHLTANTIGQVRDNSVSTLIRNNKGFVTEKGGVATILSGTTSIVVNHGLDVTPNPSDTKIVMSESPTNDPGNTFVNNFTSTQFTINSRNDPGASNLDFGWQVAVL